MSAPIVRPPAPPRYTFTLEQRDAVDAARTTLRGCVVLLEHLIDSEDFAGDDEIDAFDVILNRPTRRVDRAGPQHRGR